jgi:hypothetical protein
VRRVGRGDGTHLLVRLDECETVLGAAQSASSSSSAGPWHKRIAIGLRGRRWYAERIQPRASVSQSSPAQWKQGVNDPLFDRFHAVVGLDELAALFKDERRALGLFGRLEGAETGVSAV